MPRAKLLLDVAHVFAQRMGYWEYLCFFSPANIECQRLGLADYRIDLLAARCITTEIANVIGDPEASHAFRDDLARQLARHRFRLEDLSMAEMTIQPDRDRTGSSFRTGVVLEYRGRRVVRNTDCTGHVLPPHC